MTISIIYAQMRDEVRRAREQGGEKAAQAQEELQRRQFIEAGKGMVKGFIHGGPIGGLIGFALGGFRAKPGPQ